MTGRRFVVLRHDGVALPHFDLLFEWEPGEPLTSFRCPAWPPRVGDRWEEAAEHRRVYLTYEGDLSGGRGVVRRVAAGTIAHEVLVADPPTLALVLENGVGIVVANDVAGESLVGWIVQSCENGTPSDAVV